MTFCIYVLNSDLEVQPHRRNAMSYYMTFSKNGVPLTPVFFSICVEGYLDFSDFHSCDRTDVADIILTDDPQMVQIFPLCAPQAVVIFVSFEHHGLNLPDGVHSFVIDDVSRVQETAKAIGQSYRDKHR